MGIDKNTLLVAWDFTPVAHYAFEHAQIFAKNVKAEIALVHIVKKTSNIKGAIKKMKESVENISNEKGAKPHIIVREGSIFSTIKKVAEEMNAVMVLMGTHGIKGMQKLTGSWALKVIAGSKIPFVVVQKAPVNRQYSSIVFPVDFKAESKAKLNWAEFMGKFFQAKIRIITPQVTEEKMLRQTKANLIFAKKYLASRGISYEIDVADKKNDFAQEVVNFSKKIEADIIMITTTKNISFQDYMLGAHEQFVIANSAHIPVMCVNPRTDLIKYGAFS